MFIARCSWIQGLAAGAACTLVAPSALALQPLSAFLGSAREYNFDRLEDAATVAQREADSATARRRLLPVITAKGQYTYNQYEAEVTLPAGTTKVTALLSPQNEWDGLVMSSLPLVDLSSWANIRSASLRHKAALARLEATTVDVDKQVARGFYDVLVNRALVTSAERALATDEASLAEVLVRMAAGTAEQLEVERSKASVESSRQSVETAVYNVAVAERRLATLSGLAPLPGGTLVDDDLHAEAPLETFSGTKTARQIAAELDEDAQRSVEDQTRKRLLPTLSANGTERFTNATGFANNSVFFQGLVTLSWTFDASLFSETASQRAASEEMAVRTARTARDKDDDVYTSWLRVRAQIASCRAARANAESTKLAYQIARTRYAAGTAQQIDLLQADRDAFSADVTRIQTNGDLRYDRIALKLAAGRPIEQEETP
jgi:outer membrane protein TolC